MFQIFKTKVDSISWPTWFNLDTYVWVIGRNIISASFSDHSSTWSNDIFDDGLYKMVFLLVLYQFGFPHLPLVSHARSLVRFWRHLVFGPQNAFAKLILAKFSFIIYCFKKSSCHMNHMWHDSCGLFDKVVRIRSGNSRSLAEFYQCMCVEIWSKDLVSKFRMGNQFKAFSSFFLTVFYNKIFQNLIRL